MGEILSLSLSLSFSLSLFFFFFFFLKLLSSDISVFGSVKKLFIIVPAKQILLYYILSNRVLDNEDPTTRPLSLVK